MNFGGIVNQRPGDRYQNQQSQGQSPWSQPPLSHPPASIHYSPASPSPGFRPPVPPAPPKRGRRIGKKKAVLLGVAALVLIGVVFTALSGGNSKTNPSAALTSTSSSQASSRLSAAEKACSKRAVATGDIYVRVITRGGAPHAKRLGPQWGWDYTANKCLTAAETAVATAPQESGDCTQVGYVAKNPGYDVKAARPSPLKHVAAEAGSSCKTSTALAAAKPAAPAAKQTPPAETAPSASPQTAPAAAPSSAYTPPPAPATCTPLTDGGNCYEPGEYCRDADHGASGVAGDGESITCEDNDGWRWEQV